MKMTNDKWKMTMAISLLDSFKNRMSWWKNLKRLLVKMEKKKSCIESFAKYQCPSFVQIPCQQYSPIFIEHIWTSTYIWNRKKPYIRKKI